MCVFNCVHLCVGYTLIWNMQYSIQPRLCVPVWGQFQ